MKTKSKKSASRLKNPIYKLYLDFNYPPVDIESLSFLSKIIKESDNPDFYRGLLVILYDGDILVSMMHIEFIVCPDENSPVWFDVVFPYIGSRY